MTRSRFLDSLRFGARLGARLAACLALGACTSRPPADSPATSPAPRRDSTPTAPASAPAPRAQNPSPMEERTRAHQRLPQAEPPGTRFTANAGFGQPVDVFIPARARGAADADLLIHFFGLAYVPIQAAAAATRPTVVAVVNLGSGSAAYERPFAADPARFDSLVAAVVRAVSERAGVPYAPRRVTLSAFSAGYGAVRAVLGTARGLAAVDAVLLLDGLHASYVPERTPLAEGGALDSARLAPFLAFARLAVAGQKTFVVTHSEIFPGTYASTTETTDYLVRALGMRRTPVLAWGPVGMQQLSEVRAGGLAILGFAGNSAPDHVDHFHGMGKFIELVAPCPPGGRC